MVIVVIGLFGIAGSVTGSLMSMLAALFDPSILGSPGSMTASGTNPGKQAVTIPGANNPADPAFLFQQGFLNPLGSAGNAISGIIP